MANAAKPGRLTVQGKAVSPEDKQAVLDDVKILVPTGLTLAQIAAKHGIAERTLEYWLSDLGDEYVGLRRLWIDNMLHEAGELLKDSREDGNAALRLARARELWKRATWFAEKRDRARYGQDVPTVQNAVQIVINGVRSQQYDKEAPQHGHVIEAPAVDKP